MWIIIWKNVYDSWSPWPGPRGCFSALSGHRSSTSLFSHSSACNEACDIRRSFSVQANFPEFARLATGCSHEITQATEKIHG